MAGDQQTCPLSVEEAKARLVEEEPEESPPTIAGWVSRHPVESMLAAAGLGAVMVFFPRLRRLAVPVAIAVIRRAMF